MLQSYPLVLHFFMYTGNNLDNWDKGKLILMVQVRQVISLVTSHPYTVKNGVLRYTFAMVFWDTFIYVGVT